MGVSFYLAQIRTPPFPHRQNLHDLPSHWGVLAHEVRARYGKANEAEIALIEFLREIIMF